MEKGGPGQPGQKGGVFHRVPSPVTAPAQLDIGPLHAEDIADGQEEPGEEGPAPDALDPAFIQALVDQGRDGEGKGDSEGDEADIEAGGMEDHAGILQQGIEAVAVFGHERQFGEGVGLEGGQIEKKEGRELDDRHRGRHQLRMAFFVGVEHDDAEYRQQPGPEEQRAVLAGPKGGQRIEPGERAV